MKKSSRKLAIRSETIQVLLALEGTHLKRVMGADGTGDPPIVLTNNVNGDPQSGVNCLAR